MSTWIQDQFTKKLSPDKLFWELFKNTANSEASKAYLQVIASKVTVAFPIAHTSKALAVEHEETMGHKASTVSTCISFSIQPSPSRSFRLLVGPPESGKKPSADKFWKDFGFVKLQDLCLFGQNNYSTWELDDYKYEDIKTKKLLTQLLELPCSPIQLDDYQHVVCDEESKQFHCITGILSDEYPASEKRKKVRENWLLTKIEPQNLGDIFIWAAYAKLFRLSVRKALAKAPNVKALKQNSKRSINLRSAKLGDMGPATPLAVPLDTRELDLSMNDLKQVPDWVRGLTKLEFLSLYANKISELPEWISELKALKRLDVSTNPLKQLPESLGLLKNLTRFECIGNQLSALPQSLFQLSKLEQLDANNNKIKKLPSTIGDAKALQYLNLSKNSIKSLPKGFAELLKLERLDLSSNPLDFPKEICALEKLNQLNLENAEVTAVPDEFKPAHLTKLWLSSNKIAKFPILERFQSLNLLTLQHNQIEEIPTHLQHTKLEHLGLSNNLLKAVPDFSGCTALRSFYMTNNKISSLPSPLNIPASLKEWQLGKNQITNFSASSIDKKLHEKLRVYLNENPIDQTCRKELEDLDLIVKFE